MSQCSFLGIVNIWCAGAHELRSSSNSNNGKSTTHRKLNSFLSYNSRSAPSLFLSFANVSLHLAGLSAMNISTVPGFAPILSISLFCTSSLKYFAILLSRPFSVTRIHAMPFEPHSWQKDIYLSISFLLISFSGLMHLIMPPDSTTDLNTPKSESLTISLTSVSSRLNLISGLSHPNLSMDSLYLSLGKLPFISISSVSFIIAFMLPSPIS